MMTVAEIQDDRADGCVRVYGFAPREGGGTAWQRVTVRDDGVRDVHVIDGTLCGAPHMYAPAMPSGALYWCGGFRLMTADEIRTTAERVLKTE